MIYQVNQKENFIVPLFHYKINKISIPFRLHSHLGSLPVVYLWVFFRIFPPLLSHFPAGIQPSAPHPPSSPALAFSSFHDAFKSSASCQWRDPQTERDWISSPGMLQVSRLCCSAATRFSWGCPGKGGEIKSKERKEKKKERSELKLGKGRLETLQTIPGK